MLDFARDVLLFPESRPAFALALHWWSPSAGGSVPYAGEKTVPLFFSAYPLNPSPIWPESCGCLIHGGWILRCDIIKLPNRLILQCIPLAWMANHLEIVCMGLQENSLKVCVFVYVSFKEYVFSNSFLCYCSDLPQITYRYRWESLSPLLIHLPADPTSVQHFQNKKAMVFSLPLHSLPVQYFKDTCHQPNSLLPTLHCSRKVVWSPLIC